MEIKILDSIIHGELKPWLVNFNKIANFNDIVKEASKIQPTTPDNITLRLKKLLTPFPALNNSIPANGFNEVKALCAIADTPAPKDLITTYYHLLISTEILRYYNQVLSNPFIIDEKIDVHYQIGHKVLKSLAALASQAQNTLLEDELTEEITIQLNPIHFTLVYLMKAVVALYFAIQEIHKDNLKGVYESVDDFYMFNMADNSNKPLIKITEPNIKVTSIAQSNNEAFSFGFKGDSDKLKQLIQLLCTHHNLLDETVTKQDDFLQLLTTKNIYDKKYKIQFGCNTNLATYILESLKRSIPKLKFSNIENCGYFFTDNGKFLKQSNLSNSKSKNELTSEPKAKIDKIFKDCSI